MSIELICEKLNTPTDFEFPFTPYEIQYDFMKNLYTVLEEGKLGIFESPTGTGKSLSIICGALQWLKDHELRERREIDQTIDKLKKEKDHLNSGDDWLTSQSQEIEISKKLQQLQLTLNKIQKNDDKISKLKEQKKELEKNNFKYKEKKDDVLFEQNENEELELLLEENINLDELSDDEKVEEDKYENLKIFICSRTHSQISQLVHEVSKTVFSSDIRLISLASRQNYCINTSVSKLTNPFLINERCLDLQKSSKPKNTSVDNNGKATKKKKSSCKCPYMQSQKIEELKTSALIEIQDVEELTQKGKKLNACPYYAARSAVEDAQVIFLPYNLVLHQSTREASGIKLKNNVVIIDEAHNLLEALTDMHSSHITGHQLLHAHTQLSEYKNKYQTRFTAQNILYINQILFIVARFIKMLGGKPGCSTNEICKEESKMMKLEDYLVESDIEHLNLYKILKFCALSKISQKLNGFALKYQNTVTINEKKNIKIGVKAFLQEISKNSTVEEVQEPIKEFISEDTPRNPILYVIQFLETLTHRSEDGRIICIRQNTVGKGILKFLLLNPSCHFEKIVQEARSVIVAGGTMQPMNEFRQRLFLSSGAKLERILEFSCDHIVPKENILPVILTSGPTGKCLDFSFANRKSTEMLNEVGRVLQNICNIIPGGIVCFFPSYDYEKLIYNHLQSNKVLETISIKKQIFREPKTSSEVDKILTQYSKAIKHAQHPKSGALMFSVVGGKLSEGLNFSDDLGRCVMVIGMPYANIKSPELQEKMAYLNKNEGSNAGNIYYENICMKAVNQCIGRAVRHKNDYANVILLDNRYSRLKTQQSLPNWIQRSLVLHEKFGPAFSQICKFFAAKK